MIDRQAGGQLLAIARNTLTLFLEYGEKYTPDASHLAPCLLQPASSFVTLYNDHFSKHRDSLRGCIGSTHASLPLVQDVIRNTVAAARDPRFAPVLAAELPDLTIHISILHAARRLLYDDYTRLLHSLRPGIDGVIVSWREHRGLLLPQVWERIADPDAFMQALCHKAHIPLQKICGPSPEAEVFTFETTSFSEGEVQFRSGYKGEAGNEP